MKRAWNWFKGMWNYSHRNPFDVGWGEFFKIQGAKFVVFGIGMVASLIAAIAVTALVVFVMLGWNCMGL